jgi:dimethylamine/trimethylamine dehydrogenase
MRWIPQLPGLGEWKRFVDYRKIQLNKLANVEVHTGIRLTADAIRDYGAEIVVIATGARWAGDGLNAATHDPIPGADASLPNVLTPEQVMLAGKRPSGRRVVVYDCEGYFMAPGLAEKLAGEGYQVELVTVLETVSPHSDETLEGTQLRQHLHDIGVSMQTNVSLDAIGDGVLHCSSYGDPLEITADAVVLVTQRLSNEQLYLELRAAGATLKSAGVEALYRIGDCLAPRLLADASFDGHRLGREIDSDNPAIPLPYLRERLVPELNRN